MYGTHDETLIESKHHDQLDCKELRERPSAYQLVFCEAVENEQAI